MTLVFPRVKPLGANSQSRNSIRKDHEYATEVIDYLKLTIYEHEKKKGINTGGGKKKSGGKIKDTIYLYLPPGLNESYAARYKGVNLGGVGAAALAAAGDIGPSGPGESFAANISAAADAAKPALGYKAASAALSNVVGKVSPYGFSIDSNDLAQLTDGKVFNPYEETLFQSTGFMDHNFKFTMQPKGASDVQVIYEIISALRQAMHPSVDANDWLTIPDKFEAEIVRYVSKGDRETISGKIDGKGGFMQALLRFPNKMVLKNMNVDFGDSSAIRTHTPGMENEDFGFVIYNMSLSFQETKYRTREDFLDT